MKPWTLGAITGGLFGLFWFLGRSPGADAPPGPGPMVNWLMEQAVHLDRNTAQDLWFVTARHVPNVLLGDVNARLLMLSLSWQESSWRFDAMGDDGLSMGLYQMQKAALDDVRTFYDPAFPVDPDRLTDPEYATQAAWGFLQVNLKSGRANGDLELALAMHNTGPSRRDLAESRRWWGRQIIERALEWQKEAPL